MHKLGFAVSSALMCALASNASAGELRLSMANGRVTIVAQDVPLRQILDEWGRVGQTQVVGAERLTGGPITLELHDVPEGRALETLLRSASGYIAKPRSGTAGTSSYDRILIMPASKPPAMSAAPPAFNAARPQPQVVMPNVVVDDDAEPNGIMPPGMVPPPQQFPGQPPPPLQPGMQPGVQPQPMPTLSRPGQLPPPTPNMPGNPYQMVPQPNQPMPQPVRPPGAPPGPGGGPGGAY